MAFNSLFVPLAFEETAKVSIEAALTLAGTFKSHVLAHHVRQRYAAYPPMDFFAASAAATVVVQDNHDEATAAFARTVRAMFEETCDRNGAKIVPVSEALKQSGTTASWNETIGHLSQDYSLAARVADLVVTAIPAAKDIYLEREIFETVLLQSGAPVMAVPRSGLVGLPRRPLVAWDGSLQSARAIRAALPLLLESEETTLLTIGETDPGTPKLEDARLWLERSGVNVTGKTIDWPQGPTAERILNQCDAVNADLLVMGGYSHSRLREAIVGGVTLHILRHANRPVFLIH